MDFVLFLYWASLIIGGVFLIALGLLGHFTGGGDVGGHDVAIGGHDVDVGGGHDAAAHVGHVGGEATAPSITPLSPFIIATFLTMFGATGLACDSLGVWRPIAMPLSGVSGFAVATLTFYAMAKLLTFAQGTSHFRLSEIEGLEATVTTPISGDGIGEVAFTISGSRRTSAARSEDGAAIGKHATVRIAKVVGNTVLVRESVDERLRKLKPDAEE